MFQFLFRMKCWYYRLKSYLYIHNLPSSTIYISKVSLVIHMYTYIYIHITTHIMHIVVLQKSLAILFPHHPHVDTPHALYRFMDWRCLTRCDGIGYGWSSLSLKWFPHVSSSRTRVTCTYIYIYIYTYPVYIYFLKCTHVYLLDVSPFPVKVSTWVMTTKCL